MKALEPMRIAWREQRRRPGRALAVGLGFLLAVASFVGFSLLFRAEHAMEEATLRRVGGYFVAFSPLPVTGIATPPATIPRVRHPDEGFVVGTVLTSLLPRSLGEAIRRSPGVADVVPVLQFRMKSARDTHLFTLGGIDLSRPIAVARTCCAPSEVTAGVFLGQATGTEGPGAMLDNGYASVQEYRVGDRITIGERSFPVTGIVNTGIRPSRSDVYLTWEDAARLLAPRLEEPLGERTGLFLVEVDSASQQEDAMAAVKRITGGVITSYNCFRPAAKVVGLNERAAGIVSVLLYISAVLFGLKTQFGALVERRREFGILRAVGWSGRVLGAQLVWEAVIPAFFGALAGATLGVGAALVAGNQVLGTVGLPIPLAEGWWLGLQGIAFALAGSGLVGLAAAVLLRYSRPADTLRTI
ncbi:MAG TPA: FtsX-like permease family protein [Candidatus Ozemobacteraceae bacterium]